MKNISFYKLLLISSLINISLYADSCNFTGEDKIKKESLDLYNKSQGSYSNSEYDKAYFDLTKSYELYTTENPKLTIHSTCIHIKPGPFGAVRSRYTKKDDYTFNRKDLG
ncbi:MAG: hypothetical protein U9R37_02170, partial [Campylobacterota bacterium]|nr:hypothetical protein [Campylobacterota bacterium]